MSLKSLSRVRRPRGSPRPVTTSTASRVRRHRGWIIAAASVIVLLLLIRFVGSPLAKAAVNRKLAEMPDFVARAEAVTLAVWRGGLDVRDFVLYERGFENEPPLLHVKKASVAFAPGALFTGKLGGSIRVTGLEVNAIKRTDDEAGPKGQEPEEREAEVKAEVQEKKEAVKRWQDELRQAIPMEITRFELTDGRIHFVDVTKQPEAEVAIENLRVVATDLQNRPEPDGDPLPAKVQVEGVMTGNGQLKASVAVDPLAEQPRFQGSFEVRGLSLPPLNSFLLAYANADVSAGTFEVYSEIQAQNGAYEGYVKPLFHDLDFRTASDRDKNAAELLAKKVVTAVASLLENEDEEQVATRAPFSGNFADNEVDIWTTIATLFRNAFVQALRGGFEGQPAGAAE